MTPRTRLGVAFWEVLVVLAIVAFLVAFLFPIFNGVGVKNQRRHRSSCQSNEKQLGLGILQYARDADGNFPLGLTAAGNGWAGEIYPYVKSTGAYRCPDDSANGQFISYAANQSLLKQPLTKLSNPAATVALYETTTLNCDPATAEAVSGVGLAAPPDSNRHDQQTHKLNFLAADGHVQYLLPTQVSSGPNAQAARPITIIHRGLVIETFSVK